MRIDAGVHIQILAELRDRNTRGFSPCLRSRIGPVRAVAGDVPPHAFFVHVYPRKPHGFCLGEKVVAQTRVRDPELEGRNEQLHDGVAQRT